MSPKQPSPRRVRKSDIGVIIILVLVLVGIAMLVNRTLNKADELTQQDFYQILEDERFQEIVIQPAGGSENQNLYRLTGRYLNKEGEKLSGEDVQSDKVYLVCMYQVPYRYLQR